jgi:hypothetical protein
MISMLLLCYQIANYDIMGYDIRCDIVCDVIRFHSAVNSSLAAVLCLFVSLVLALALHTRSRLTASASAIDIQVGRCQWWHSQQFTV